MYEFERLQLQAAEQHRLTDDQLRRISKEWREDALRRQDDRLAAHRLTAEPERPILIDFESRGFATSSVGALRMHYKDYSSLVPIIFSHLKRNYQDKIREDLARLLENSAAFQYWQELAQMYIEADPDSNEGLMTGIAVALNGLYKLTKNPDLLNKIYKLLRDRSRGVTRIMMLDCIRRKRDGESVALITELAADPDLKKEITSWKRAGLK